MKTALRFIPPIHEIQRHPTFQKIGNETGTSEDKLTDWAKEKIGSIRTDILEGRRLDETIDVSTLVAEVFAYLQRKSEQQKKYTLRPVINGTGTILHTNLGRAKLSEDALQQVQLAAKHYSNLEYNLESGKRGSRHDIIEEVIKEITGAEAAMVVNNNAAAVYFILKTFAKNKEVIVSRGQLVEIGGSFRVSSIMEESGAVLKEVGTTNKTHLRDYHQAITSETAMFLKVHTSNFKTIGFTKSVEIEELVQLKEEHEDIILYEDLGSGAIYDFRNHLIGEEPTVKETLDKGVDIVSFSGDKLLGGPQAGIIAGKKVLIDKLKKHQLARVLRVDKMTLAALEATLKTYAFGEEQIKSIPTVKAILEPIVEVENKARVFSNSLEDSSFLFSFEEGTSQIGGGTMPGVEIPTMLLAVSHPKMTAQQLFDTLRQQEIPVICRIKGEKLLIDFRTIEQEEIEIVSKQFWNIEETRGH
ncbi:L-seryl-tRNA(Sec) selenium transferase [Bacillus alkalicellulosilyticus]|uniref:L-seryl-tRNA(Sec) selenium transferase n=1 Tax=Alkalihalobacterium alkalicellulosilyticum TaxID=1912214 RepID=UPI000998AF60|nr:L-seryl-tRNA(Sec) selenium transferase [Bacillus alkalicellulosilyticus]